jgi:hypothetical protein
VAETTLVPGFLPSTHGLHFANRFPPGPTVRLGPLDSRWIGIGDASNGLCGGMVTFVRERFEAGQPIVADREVPANGSPLFQALVRRQVKSLEWLRTPIHFWWAGLLGPGRTARRTRDTEWPRIRDTIAAGRLAMVGLVRHQGVNPFNLTRSHQVLGYGFELDREAVTLRLYDPNWPDRDDVAVVLAPRSIRQTTGETIYGFLSLP